MNKPFKVRLHIISPLHIGCDDAYEPTGFVIDRTRKKMIVFDELDFVQSLSEANRRKFLEICGRGTIASIIELYKFMDGQAHQVSGTESDISDDFIANYDRVKGMPLHNEERIKQELNKFAVARTSYLAIDSAPFIPGTSLKGCLRTGWLNAINRKTKVPPGRDARRLEEQLLGGTFDTDPFRLVKVADLIPTGRPVTRIRYALNKKKRISDREARGPLQILETVEPGAVFEGLITLESPPTKSAVPKPVPTGTEFFQNIGAFFGRELEAEENILNTIGMPAIVIGRLKQQFGAALGTTVIPIRLGRHSGAACVTIEGHRSIKIMGKRGDPPKYGANALTLWLAADSARATSGLLPFGWAALEILEAEVRSLWPGREIRAKERTVSAAIGAIPSAAAPPKAPPEQIIWEGVALGWNAGTATLTVAAPDGKGRADLKVGADRNLLSEEVVNRLKKGKIVKARVVVEHIGGTSYRIVGVVLS